MSTENQNVQATANVENKCEKKAESKLTKIGKSLLKGAVVLAAAIGVDHVVTGGKGTKWVVDNTKKGVSAVSTKMKKSPKTDAPVVSNQNPGAPQGGRQHYDNRPHQQNRNFEKKYYDECK